MQVISVRLTHDCPYSTPVAQAPRARVTHLCHRGTEALLEIHDPDPASFERLLATYRRENGTVLFEEADRSAALLRFPTCACCRRGRVIPTIEADGYLYLPPSRYTRRGEEYQFLTMSARADPRAVRRLPAEVNVLQIGTSPMTSLGFEQGFLVPVGTLFRGLTPRQRQAIVTAVVRGYYRIPRPVTTSELARTLEVSRPAFESLLRKAENRIVAGLFPYLTVPGLMGAASEPAPSVPVRPIRSSGRARAGTPRNKRRRPRRATEPPRGRGPDRIDRTGTSERSHANRSAAGLRADGKQHRP